MNARVMLFRNYNNTVFLGRHALTVFVREHAVIIGNVQIGHLIPVRAEIRQEPAQIITIAVMTQANQD